MSRRAQQSSSWSSLRRGRPAGRSARGRTARAERDQRDRGRHGGDEDRASDRHGRRWSATADGMSLPRSSRARPYLGRRDRRDRPPAAGGYGTGCYARPVERFIEVPGGRLLVVDDGDGPPIILVHAAIADHRAWDAMIPGLVAAGFHAIRHDLRGLGRSTTADVAFSNRADLIAVLDGFRIDRAVLVGNSARRPDRVRHGDRVPRPGRGGRRRRRRASAGSRARATPEEEAIFEEMDRLEIGRSTRPRRDRRPRRPGLGRRARAIGRAGPDGDPRGRPDDGPAALPARPGRRPADRPRSAGPRASRRAALSDPGDRRRPRLLRRQPDRSSISRRTLRMPGRSSCPTSPT